MDIFRFDKITSSNDLARSLFGDKDDEFVVVAKEQTGGKGRNDRKWESPPGNLYFSLCTKVTRAATLRAGVAVAKCLDDLGLKVSLKWPNDVLVDGKKIAGILSEGVNNHVIIGFGVNVNKVPVENATSIVNELDRDIDCETLMEGMISRFQKCEDFMATYRKFSCTIGRNVKIKTPSGIEKGLVEDVDEQGRLIFEDGRKILAGDVIYLREDNE